MSEVIRTISRKPGMKVLEDVVRLDNLKPHIARMHTIEEGLVESRAMMSEITKVGKFVQTHGFTPGRDFQRVSSIPSSVWSAVLEVFGDEWDAADVKGRRELFYALLAGPLRDYDLRFKPTLT